MAGVTVDGAASRAFVASGDLDRHVDAALGAGQRLAAAAAALAFASSYDDASTGVIDVPPITASEDERARLHATAPLYLVSELEATGLLRGAEVLAGLAVTGGLQGDLGDAAPSLHRYWQDRHRRFTAEERSAIFVRLFGEGEGMALAVRGARNVAFESLLIDGADAVYSCEPAWDGRLPPAAAVALQSAASALASNLGNRMVGVPDLAGAELVGSAQQALDLFRAPGVQRAVGADSTWNAVAKVATRYLDANPAIAWRVTRGRTGLVLLAWVADALPALGDLGALPLPPDSVRSAAGGWMEATLALRESEAAHGAGPNRPASA